jgi:hypothetical protein
MKEKGGPELYRGAVPSILAESDSEFVERHTVITLCNSV